MIEYSRKAVVVFFMAVFSFVFILIHLDSSPSQALLSALVWCFPLVMIACYPVGLTRMEILFVFFALLLFLSALSSFWLAGDLSDYRAFRTNWLYLLALSLVPLFASAQPAKTWLYILLVVAALASLIVVGKDVALGWIRGRHHGLPIPYGSVSLITALLCLMFSFDRMQNRWMRFALVAGFLMGLVAVVWSQTRGVWLYFAVWTGVALIIWLKSDTTFKQKAAVIAGITLLVSVILSSGAGDLISRRISQAADEAVKYAENDAAKSSTGQRLELWQVAISTFVDNPVWGGGYSGFLAKRDEMTGNGSVYVYKSLKHPHNDILWMMASRGMIGLLIFLAFYGVLLRYYFKCLSDKKTILYGQAGLTVLFGAFVFGLTDIYLSLKITIGYFFIINVFLIRLIEQERVRAE